MMTTIVFTTMQFHVFSPSTETARTMPHVT